MLPCEIHICYRILFFAEPRSLVRELNGLFAFTLIVMISTVSQSHYLDLPCVLQLFFFFFCFSLVVLPIDFKVAVWLLLAATLHLLQH